MNNAIKLNNFIDSILNGEWSNQNTAIYPKIGNYENYVVCFKNQSGDKVYVETFYNGVDKENLRMIGVENLNLKKYEDQFLCNLMAKEGFGPEINERGFSSFVSNFDLDLYEAARKIELYGEGFSKVVFLFSHKDAGDDFFVMRVDGNYYYILMFGLSDKEDRYLTQKISSYIEESGL